MERFEELMLVEGSDKWRGVVSTVMNIRVVEKIKNILNV